MNRKSRHLEVIQTCQFAYIPHKLEFAAVHVHVLCAACEHTKMCTLKVLCNVYSIRYIDIYISLFQSLSTYCIHRERKHKITVATMSGVIQNTAERSVLKGVVTSYFDDSMHSFVNACKLTRDEVYSMENSIMKQLEVS